MYVQRPQDIGALIRDRRKAKGWTQAQLGLQLGVPQRTVGRMENSLHASRVDLVLATLNLLGVRLWADTGEGSNEPTGLKAQPTTAKDVTALVDAMLSEL